MIKYINLFSLEKNTQNEQKIVSINDHHIKEKSDKNLMDLVNEIIKEESLQIGFSKVKTTTKNKEFIKKKTNNQILMIIIFLNMNT